MAGAGGGTAMIALFDSGLGGLSVLREVRKLLPTHDLMYVADSAYCPYGPRSAAWVRERSLLIGRWAMQQGAQMLVVACNTASSAALETLRAELSIPIVGMEPGIKPAALATRSGHVGVLATAGTLQSQRFASLVERFGDAVYVHIQPCYGWVEQVEAGALASAETRALVERNVVPLLAQGVDTLVLGCTHYPFLRPLIAEIAGVGVAIIDTGPAVARQVEQLAATHQMNGGSGSVRAFTTGTPDVVAPVIQRLIGEHLIVTCARPLCAV